MTTEHMPAPCQHCPFLKSVKPFLHPRRAFDIAVSSQYTFGEFYCHKTTVEDDEGDSYVGESAQLCAGFLTMKARQCQQDDLPEGFIPSWDLVYEDAQDMYEAYQKESNRC